MRGSYAAAHGCGSAFVRRMTRVGTGWRLHALVAELVDALARGASAPRGAFRFKSGRAHNAFVAPAARARSWYERGHGFESRRRLHSVVARQVRASPCQVEGHRFEAGQPLQAVLAQLAEAQVPGTWRSGFESPGRYSWKVNRPGGRARPLSDAPVARWRSSRPPSSEDEPDRRLAPAGNRTAVRAVAFESPVYLHPLPVHTGPGSRFGTRTC